MPSAFPYRSSQDRHRTRTALVALVFGSALAIVGFGAGPADASDDGGLPTAEPASVGMSAEAMASFDTAMRKMVDDGSLAGMVTLVARHGKIVNFEAFGYQDLANEVPIRKDTIFRIFSMTKPVVGVALMTYYDEGRFSLDDPVAKYVPQFEGLKVAKEDGPDGKPIVEDADHPMTMRELMTHTGGLTYGLFSRSQVDSMYVQAGILDPNQTLEEMVNKLSEIPLRHQPGTAWHYSVSVDVQGYVLERLAGKPLDQVLEERIFGPLGMKDTGFWVPAEKQDRFSKLYVPDREGTPVEQPPDWFYGKPKLFSGGGGLASTAMDYARFGQMLLNGGELDGVRILKPGTVKLMRTNHLPDGVDRINPLIGNPGNVFGLDFAIVEEPAEGVSHPRAKGEFWWYGIAGTWFGLNPTEDLMVVGMIQSRGGMAARQARLESKKLAYAAIVD